MATSFTRAMPIYYEQKKVAETESATLDISSNDELLFGIDGPLGHADGHVTVTVETNCIIPFAGLSVTIVEDMLAKKYVQIGCPVGGKMYLMDCRVMTANFSSDSKSGKLSGKFTFSGSTLDTSSILLNTGRT